MCGYFCIGFINFMSKGKILLDYTNSFSPSENEKNDKIILEYFIISFFSFLLGIDSKKATVENMYYIKCNSINNLKILKYHILSIKR